MTEQTAMPTPEVIAYSENEAQSFITSGFDEFKTASAPFKIHPLTPDWEFSGDVTELERALVTVKHFVESSDQVWCKDFGKNAISDKDAHNQVSKAREAFLAITSNSNLKIALRGRYLYLIKMA